MIKKILNNKKAKYIFTSIFCIVAPFIIEKLYCVFYNRIGTPVSDTSLLRLLVFFLISVFIGLNFIIEYKKIWEFIYKKRYIIGVILFAFMVSNGLHGASVYQYNSVVEPNIKVENSAPSFGVVRPIRSDEFLVDTPAILSQLTHNDDFQTVNDAIMARDGTTVYMFPQLPTKSISVLSNPKLLGFLFLPMDMAFSWYWYILFFVCFFATFEVSMIITKGKKIYSLAGACLLTFSPAFLWWNQLSIFAGGFSAILFLNLFLKTNKIKFKFLYSILFGYSGCVFIMTLYPAWLIAFGYLFLGLFIWSLIINKKTLKWSDLIYILPVLAILGIILLPGFIGSKNTIDLMGQTLYPGARSSVGGYAGNMIFNYFIAPFYTLKDIGNPCEAGQFIGLYPIPILMSFFMIFKNYKQRKIDWFLIIFTIIAMLLSLWNFVEVPLLAKITGLSMSTPDRAQLVVNALCILLLIRIISMYEYEGKMNRKQILLAIIIAFVTTLGGLYIVNQVYSFYLVNKIIMLSVLLFVPLIFMFVINNNKSNKILAISLIMISLFSFVTIQPISSGLKIMRDKPFAQEIQKIVEKDKEAKWAVVNPGNTTIHLQGYLLSNGARVINSTNYYPNFDLWDKLDKKGKYDEVYNRYAHVAINIWDKKTEFALLQADLFDLRINKDDVSKLGIQYLASTVDLTTFNTEAVKYDKIYKKDNIYIFKFVELGGE